MSIPKIIHYCWFGNTELSPLHKRCIQSWKKHLPDYEIKEWGDQDIPSGIPYLQSMLKAKEWAFVSDFMRHYVLNEYGGIYLDVDVEVVKSFNDLLDNTVFLGFEAKNRLNTAVLGSVKNSFFTQRSMQVLIERFESKKSYLIAPELANLISAEPGVDNKLQLYSEEYFYPYNPFDKNRPVDFLMASDITINTYCIHHWSHTWKPNPVIRLFRYFKKLLELKK